MGSPGCLKIRRGPWMGPLKGSVPAETRHFERKGLGSRVRIDEDLVFEITDDGHPVVPVDEVIGIDRHFPAAAGGIDNKLGDRVARGVPAELLDDFDALGDAGTEVGGPFDEVALIKIIRADAAAQQLLHKDLIDGGVIVDAPQEDALVPQRDAVVGEPLEGGFYLGGQFPGMIDVDAHPERMVFGQHAAQLRGDALGEENGDAGADPEELNVLDVAQAAEEGLEFVVGKEQGIAAGKEHVPDFGVGFEIAESGLPFGVEFLLAHPAHDPAAGAVAAIGGAAVGDEEKDAVGITVDEAGDGHVAVFAARVGHFFRIVPGLLNPGHDLTADRAIRVGGVDQVEVMGGNGEGQFIA